MDYLQQLHDNDSELTEIIIKKNISNDVLCQLSKALKNNTYVKKLCIKGSFNGNLSYISDLLDQFDYFGIKYLSKYLKKNNSIEILDLSKNYISSLSMYYICDMLKENTSITKLIMDSCNIDREHISLLKNALVVNTTLKKINLSNNHFVIDDNFCEIIKHNKSIESIITKYLDIYDIDGDLESDTKLLGDALINNTTLNTLSLSNMYIKKTKYISNALSKNCTLKFLNLNHNDINSIELANSLVNNTHLRYLNIGHYYNTPEDSANFIKTIINNKTLKTLIIEVDDNFYKELYNYLSNNTTLTKLIIYHDPCSKNNIETCHKYLAKSLANNKTLRYLKYDIYDNTILDYLVDALATNTSLKTLILDKMKINKKNINSMIKYIIKFII